MVQLNLLPDVKLKYIKAQRTRRMLTSVSFIVAAASVALLILLLGVDLAQKKHLSDLNKDIKNESATLQQKPDISKILTVQNQLQSLAALHTSKPAASRLFSTYLDEITPASVVSVTDLHIDFTQMTATITGQADTLATVNKFVDTLKFTTYTTDSNKTPTNAFKDVVLTNFSLNNQTTGSTLAASYTIDLSYANTIFDITQNVALSVPNLITTRSEIAQPTDLFQTPADSASRGGH